MEFEDYLIEQHYQIMAIGRISQIIDDFICRNFGNIGENKNYLEEILALNTAIQMIAYCMRIRRKEYYRELDEHYQDNFTYDSVVSELGL